MKVAAITAVCQLKGSVSVLGKNTVCEQAGSFYSSET